MIEMRSGHVFGWIRRWREYKRERERLYAMETPYSTMFNIAPDEAAGYLARFQYNTKIAASVRPMTDEEMRKYAD
jgi:hypothetical protein